MLINLAHNVLNMDFEPMLENGKNVTVYALLKTALANHGESEQEVIYDLLFRMNENKESKEIEMSAMEIEALRRIIGKSLLTSFVKEQILRLLKKEENENTKKKEILEDVKEKKSAR